MDIDNVVAIRKGRLCDRHIIWHLTDWCNYRCSYCIQTHKHHSNPLPTREKLLETVREVRGNLDLLRPVEKEEIVLIGGEIGYLPIQDIVPIIKKSNTRLQATTNASYIDNFLKCKGGIDKFVCSYHEEMTDWNSFYERALKLYEIADVTIEMVVHSGNIDEAIRIYNESKLKINFNLKRDCKDGKVLPGKSDERTMDFLKSVERGGKSVTISYRDGSREITSRTAVLNDFPEGSFPSKGWVCRDCDRSVTVTPKGELRSKCPACGEGFADRICTMERCGLCGNIYLTKF